MSVDFSISDKGKIRFRLEKLNFLIKIPEKIVVDMLKCFLSMKILHLPKKLSRTVLVLFKGSLSFIKFCLKINNYVMFPFVFLEKHRCSNILKSS